MQFSRTNMASIFYLTRRLFPFILCVFFIPSTTQIAVSIHGNKAVKRYDNLHLNCSSDTIPSRMAADIQINGISHTRITLIDGECSSRALNKTCVPEVCSCSKDGSWFSYIYKAVLPDSNLSVSCSMIFGKQGSVTESIQVRIVEFSDPAITTDPVMPITAGSEVTFTCLLETSYENVNFEWDCLQNNISKKVHQYNLTFSTFVIRKINLTQNDEPCTCIAYVEGIVAKTSIHLRISGKPMIDTGGKVRCNSSSLPNMSCIIRTGLQEYGFSSWLHFNSGILIRRLNGTNTEKKSILNIGSCSYEDAGEYACEAWTVYDDTYYTSKKSVTLLVYESPVIISSSVIRKQKTYFSVLFYSTSETHSIWRQLNHSLINSTQVMQTTDRQIIGVQFYNTTIECEVYIANLSVSFPTGRYEILLQNAFGETRYYFKEDAIISKDMTASFSLWILVLALISFGIFILTAVGTTILAKGRNGNNVIHIVGPHERCPTIPIYHSAPAFPQAPHLYDTTDNGYLQVIDNTYELNNYSEIDNTDDEDDMMFNTQGDYEEIE